MKSYILTFILLCICIPGALSCSASSNSVSSLIAAASNLRDNEDIERLSGIVLLMKYAAQKNKNLTDASVTYFSSVEYGETKYHLLEASYIGIATVQKAIIIYQECPNGDQTSIAMLNTDKVGYVESFEGKVSNFIVFENDLCND